MEMRAGVDSRMRWALRHGRSISRPTRWLVAQVVEVETPGYSKGVTAESERQINGSLEGGDPASQRIWQNKGKEPQA